MTDTLKGRPSIFSEAIALRICERLAEGESLRAICADDDMPSRGTVFNWLLDEKHAAFLNQYTRARELQADTFVDEIPDIADDGRNDWIEKNDPDNPGWLANGENARRSQIRIDARKWMAGKLRPKKYSDKVITELTGANGGPIETKDLTPHDRAKRTAFALQAVAKKKS